MAASFVNPRGAPVMSDTALRIERPAGRQVPQDIKSHHIKRLLLCSAVYFGIPLANAADVLSFGPSSPRRLSSGSSEVVVILKGKNHA